MPDLATTSARAKITATHVIIVHASLAQLDHRLPPQPRAAGANKFSSMSPFPAAYLEGNSDANLPSLQGYTSPKALKKK